ncbi:MAG TPA: AfsR/SARP family transcriptional regulator, partial [Phytomonospora sp.]
MEFRLLGPVAAVLFDGEEPARARQILQTAVSRLRRLLAETGAGAISFGPGGYTLAVDAETVDWHRFEGLVARARRTTEPAERAEALRAALALWRGPALAGITVGPAASALELYAENELRLGHFASLADELGERVAAHPGRDRLVAAYMRALHHDGRTTAALEVFDAHRRHLADDFGLDPGGELRRLHTAILRG